MTILWHKEVLKGCERMENIKKQVKANMKALGTYKPEFDMTIGIYSSLIYQYRQLEKQFEENASQPSPCYCETTIIQKHIVQKTE